MQRKLLGIINVEFNATGQLLIIYSAFVKYLRKKWEYNEAMHQLCIDFKKTYYSARREVFVTSATKRHIKPHALSYLNCQMTYKGVANSVSKFGGILFTPIQYSARLQDP